ncbi:pyridoxamine 5'-phosphate oxidase [Candidatus Blochmannia ocreatus (nom. nud.)]|uniref:Pyridoxine/pyridoxamine 5'-phosphate oxidase n=1 Tax=Candidatus Blochmannia ocreatus (nom. nud.) TaxID=251538 RepID=A0ABY4STU0_9ENTR|nr:pyridoxamine 5'-phosphate oxidase [Candidatus Blochmannia ocreatus]URJ24878.1 pyridoxamine 5'-phosphate oxidase [Candidatus Blochmannia ocreatus]
MMKKIDISNIRREYTLGAINYSDLPDKPIKLFSAWLKQAFSSKIPDPTAMCLATVDYTGQPYQRIVLLKDFSETTMTFYTNLNSRKAFHLNHNPKVSLCFPWNVIDKQVTVIGEISKLAENIVLKNFYARPKNNQISTWVSKNQSSTISFTTLLEKKFLELKQKYLFKEIPFPKFWGGYTVHIHSIEFWHGRIYRLHDRFIYKKSNHTWCIYRLSP